MTSEEVSARVDELLSSTEKFGDFMIELERLKLINHHEVYRAYSGHVLIETWGCYERGILLEKETWHGTYKFAISVASIPTATLIHKDKNFLNNGYDPEISEGELIVVWGNCQWLKPGPWIPKIKAWLGELVAKADAARAEAERLQRERDEALVKAWS